MKMPGGPAAEISFLVSSAGPLYLSCQISQTSPYIVVSEDGPRL